MATSRDMWPLLLAVFMVHTSSLVTFPVLPVIAKEMQQGVSAATAGGLVFMALGVTSAVSSVVIGAVGNRVGLKRVFAFMCMAASLAYIGPLLAGSLVTLALT